MLLLILLFSIFVLVFTIISGNENFLSTNSDNNINNSERDTNVKRLQHNNRGPIHDFHKHFDSVNGDYPEWEASIRRYNKNFNPDNLYNSNLNLTVNNIDNVYKYVNY